MSDNSSDAGAVASSADRCLIIGGGPAGLTAAWELNGSGMTPIVFEQDDILGGISRTVNYKGYRFDIGGHRFFTKVPMVRQWWMEQLADEFLLRPRLSRIYYKDRYFDYPLKPSNALMGLGLVEAVRIGLSYLRAQAFPVREEVNLEDWVSNRFGARLYQIFFKTYTEKVWGMPCTEISADWAAQRIKNLNLLSAVKNALIGRREDGLTITSLIEHFHYPRFGPGMMWERVAERLEQAGHPVQMRCGVRRIHHAQGRVTGLTIVDGEGNERHEAGEHVISSMPIRELLHALEPAPPAPILQAADRLRYRDFLTVGLILDRSDPFPDNWIYVHSPEVKVGRIQNFRAWSPHMVPDENRSSIGLEYFVQQNDELWNASDDDLLALAAGECEQLGLIAASDVVDGVVIRMPKAYPVYDAVYKEALQEIRQYLELLPNLQLVGRNGQHRYNNQDHSMVTAIYAARNILGADHDIWNVNVDEDYHEETGAEQSQARGGGDPLVPGRVKRPTIADALRGAFARYDPVALGGAIALVTGLGLFCATALRLLHGGAEVGGTLSLLSHYLLGYQVTWPGALIGAAEAGIFGYAYGYALAMAINGTISWHQRSLIRRLQLRATFDGLHGEHRE